MPDDALFCVVTCAGVAPSSTRKFASLLYGESILLPMNPKQFPDKTGILLIFLPSFMQAAIVSVDVSFPLTTSSNFITFAGEKKSDGTIGAYYVC